MKSVRYLLQQNGQNFMENPEVLAVRNIARYLSATNGHKPEIMLELKPLARPQYPVR